MFKKLSLILITLTCTNTVLADNTSDSLYIGISGGYGSTNWNSLANHDSDPGNAPMVLDTVPEKAADRGLDYGVFMGYTFTPHYALELSYRKFRTTEVYINTTYSSLPAPFNDLAGFRSSTSNISLVNKLMLPLTDNFSIFSGVGPGITRRNDLFNDSQTVVGTFVLGVNYEVTQHILTTLEGDYTTGEGKSELYPMNDYIPFLYSIDLKLAYRF